MYNNDSELFVEDYNYIICPQCGEKHLLTEFDMDDESGICANCDVDFYIEEIPTEDGILYRTTL